MELMVFVSRQWFTATRAALFCHCRGKKPHPYQCGSPQLSFWFSEVKIQSSSIQLESFCGCNKLTAVGCATAGAFGTSFSATDPVEVMGAWKLRAPYGNFMSLSWVPQSITKDSIWLFAIFISFTEPKPDHACIPKPIFPAFSVTIGCLLSVITEKSRNFSVHYIMLLM